MRYRLLVLICAAWSGCLTTSAQVLFPLGTTWKYFIGTSEASTPDPTAWRVAGFNDTAWPTGGAPIGYGPPGVVTDLGRSQDVGYLTFYLRKEFNVVNPHDFSELNLFVRIDDGYVVWLNGVEVARYNVPEGELAYDSTSTTYTTAPANTSVTLTNAGALLREGANLIAAHVLNANLTSSDLHFDASLTGVPDTSPPVVTRLQPPAGASMRFLSTILVEFNKPVDNVEASDLLINGVPAESVSFGEPGQVVFGFTEPATGVVQVAWAPGHGITDLATTPNAFAGGSWTYTFDPSGPSSLLISEFMASNRRTLNDEDGDASDWIELHNTGDVTEHLGGYFLTDNASNPTKWRIPGVTLLPNSYLVVFASGKNRTNPAAPLHANFSLAAAGEYLALRDPAGNLVDVYAPQFPPQFEDISYGRDRGDPGIVGYFPTPTPGEPNVAGGPGFAPNVQFSRPGGTFTSNFTLSLNTDSPGAQIRYTTNGTFPTTNSALYTAPIPISVTTQVRARAFEPGLLPGEPAGAIYLRLGTSLTGFTTDLSVVVIHNFGAGTIPASPVTQRQLAAVALFEPGANGRTSLTNPAALTARAGINIRGSSTKGYPKSSYRLEFQNEFGDNRNVPVFGMPDDDDWVLYAPNQFDLPLIHNPFIYELSNDIGRYAPRTRLVEVFVNTAGGSVVGPVPSGNYRGIYVLAENIKRKRVGLDRLQPEHINPPQITGGYLLKVDRTDPDERNFSAAGLTIVYRYPAGLEMVTPQRSAQAAYIQNYIQSFGTALNGVNYRDPAVGYAAFVDVPSWIDHHLLNVLALNVDALRLSAHFHKPRNDRMHMGPIWDFDRAMGTSRGGDLRPFNPRTWMGSSPLGNTTDYGTDFFNASWLFSNPWYRRLFTDPDFWQHWIDRYQHLRRAQFSTNHLFAIVDALADQLREAQPRDLSRWQGFGSSDPSPRMGTVSVPGYAHSFPGTYQGEIDFMKRWLADRLHFMDTNFLNAPGMNHPGGLAAPGTSLALVDQSGKAGTTLYYTLNGTDPRAPGGGIATNAISYTGPFTLPGEVMVTVRARNPNHSNLTGAGNPPLSSPWSGLVKRSFVLPPATVLINEWMAGNSKTLADPAHGDFEDWIELYNPTDASVDLSGYQLTDQLYEPGRFIIPNGTSIAPRGYLLIWADGRPELNGVSPEVHANFRLSNDGEAIGLFTPDGELVDAVTFGPQTTDVSQGRWPDGARPPFHFFTNATPRAPNQLNVAPPPAPAPNQPAPDSVIINEWMADNETILADPADGEYKNWFELYNPGSAPVDLSGCTISDTLANPTRWSVPAGTIIPPGGFLLIWADGQPELMDIGGLHTNFRLSRTGEALGLYAPDGTVIDLVIFGQQQTDISQGRWPDAQLAPYYFFTTPTPGAPNVFYTGPLRFLTAEPTAAGLRLRWVVAPGQTYRVQYKDSLSDTEWLFLTPPLPATADTLTVVDLTAAEQPERYYRVVRITTP